MINDFHKPGCEFLSNFSPAVVQYRGVKYRTVEHAYQAAKTLVFAERTQIQKAPTQSRKEIGWASAQRRYRH